MNGTFIIKEIMMILRTYYCTQLLYTINLLSYLNIIFLTILYIIFLYFFLPSFYIPYFYNYRSTQ